MFLSDLEKGSSIFIDANIFIYHFSKNSNFNLSCTDFLVRIEQGDIQGITSTSVVQEVIHRMMMVEAVTQFPDIRPADLVRYLKYHPDLVKRLVIHHNIPAKILSFNLEVVSVDIQTIYRSQQMKERYGLLSNDALSLQIMEDMGIVSLASNDSDFERIDFITLFKP